MTADGAGAGAGARGSGADGAGAEAGAGESGSAVTDGDGPVDDRHPLFVPVVFAGGLLFGFGLGFGHMARPEVVLAFLQLRDLGLLFVMGGAALVTGVTVAVATRLLDRAPLSDDPYRRRLKEFDQNVLVGGAIFGVGWGLSGICPGAAYASLGVGNLPILWAVAGMFAGAYLQGRWRARRTDAAATAASAD